MSDASGDVIDREPIDVTPVSSAWVLERTARRVCSFEPSRRSYMASRYPRVYAADFVRGFLAAVPALVVERTMVEIVVANYAANPVRHVGLARAQLMRVWPPPTRAAAVRVLSAWARVERRSFDHVARAAADAHLALHEIDRNKPADVPPGFDPDNNMFSDASKAFRDMGNAFRVNTGNNTWSFAQNPDGATFLRFK